jgi:hypothetical protein
MVDGYHISAGGALTAILGMLGKLVWGGVKQDRQLLRDIHTEMTLQRTNCLTTIQTQGERQVEILEKIDTRMAEQTGYLKGLSDGRHS